MFMCVFLVRANDHTVSATFMTHVLKFHTEGRVFCVRLFPSPCAWSQEGTGTAFGPATVRIPGSQTAPAGAHKENEVQTVSW